jgi:hypothetical protein
MVLEDILEQDAVAAGAAVKIGALVATRVDVGAAQALQPLVRVHQRHYRLARLRILAFEELGCVRRLFVVQQSANCVCQSRRVF